MSTICWSFSNRPGQPLREAVSWNKIVLNFVIFFTRQPLREAVSWNLIEFFLVLSEYGQPLREAVSWNVWVLRHTQIVSSRQPLREAVSWNTCGGRSINTTRVSLFVRLWVEMQNILTLLLSELSSASSWGCELKYVGGTNLSTEATSASSWGCELKCNMRRWLLGRMQSASSWGCELKCLSPYSLPFQLPSASSWGCELKYLGYLPRLGHHRQPLREAVSWNLYLLRETPLTGCQPLREAVSWNGCIWNGSSILCRSASSWGCELKWISQEKIIRRKRRQPLREAVSWNMDIVTDGDGTPVSLFVRLWVEMLILHLESWFLRVSLFVRLWVEISVNLAFTAHPPVSLFVRLWVEIM